VQRLQGELAEARRRLEGAERKLAQQGLQALLDPAAEVAAPGGQFRLLAAEVDPAAAPTMERLREVADWLRDKLDGPCVLLLASVPNGSPQLLATVSKSLTGQGLHAGQLLKEVADAIDGRAGGRPDMAQGGGGDRKKLPQGLERGRQAVRARAGAG
jgi:alanyl-tRNA synthetase